MKSCRQSKNNKNGQNKFFSCRKLALRLFTALSLNWCIGIAAQDIGAVKSSKIHIGNFLFKWHNIFGQSTMTLMSPYWTDKQRRELIDMSQKYGMNRIHIYGINDENYSGAKGNKKSPGWGNAPYQPVLAKFTGESDPNVKMPDSWYRQTDRESLDKWRYWFIQCRKAGLKITLWLWSNQARESFNNPSVWTDKRIIDYNRKMIEQVADYEWQGEPLVDEICLKLEADDEWSERNKQQHKISVDRLNTLALAHRKLIKKQSYWWHNESTDPKIWNMVDWSAFDGVRIQVGNKPDEPVNEVIARVKKLVQQVPEDKLFYISEYYYRPDSFHSRFGDAVMEISGQWGNRFRGLDNGATASRWLEKTASIGDRTGKKFTSGVQNKPQPKKLKVFLKELAKLEHKLASVKVESVQAEEWKNNILAELSSIEEKVQDESFDFDSKDFAAMEKSVNQYFETLIVNLQKDNLKFADFILYVIKQPVTDKHLLPDSRCISGEMSGELKLTATPGEYEPASFCLRAVRTLENLSFDLTDLKNSNGDFISADNLDLKAVKCWYQAGDIFQWAPLNRGPRILTPELLLNDDSLIKTDRKTQSNYLKLGDSYVCISNQTGIPSSASKQMEHLLKDSKKLLPLKIKAYTNKQFWLTVKVPEQAPAGTYKGRIYIKQGDEVSGSMELKLKVLPFKLAAPVTNYDRQKEFTLSMYYWGELNPRENKKNVMSGKFKDSEHLLAELKNLYRHNVTNPIFIWRPALVYHNEKLFRRSLQLRQEAGIKGPLYLGDSGLVGAPHDKDDLEELKNNIEKTLKITREYGIPEVYFYGIDESKEDKLSAQKKAWNTVHKAGGKIILSGQKESNFKLMGKIQDVLVCHGALSEEEAAKWHRKDHRIFSYANPQAGLEAPETYRKNYGLLLWKANYDGASTYCYQGCAKQIWNDFKEKTYRSHNMAYPTADGVIDTIQWEGYREGIDDIRYACALCEEIVKAKQSNSISRAKAAAAAERYLNKLDVDGNLDTIRGDIIKYILQLKTLEKQRA